MTDNVIPISPTENRDYSPATIRLLAETAFAEEHPADSARIHEKLGYALMVPLEYLLDGFDYYDEDTDKTNGVAVCARMLAALIAAVDPDNPTVYMFKAIKDFSDSDKEKWLQIMKLVADGDCGEPLDSAIDRGITDLDEIIQILKKPN